MSYPAELLRTKLSLPRLRSNLVPREPLWVQLDHILDHTLTLVSAPAGFGKTTLARSWIASRNTDQERFLTAWLSLDTGDNDPVRFWRYIIVACQSLDADIGGMALAQLVSMQPFAPEASTQLAFEALLTNLLNELQNLSQVAVLIIEDYHLITSRSIHEAMTFFLDHLPRDIHVILLTRIDPPLPLARWRAHGELLELQADDLCFSQEETDAFLRLSLAFPLDEEMAKRLHQRTEGWSAGLSIIASTMRTHRASQEREYFLETLTGSYRPLVDYLVSDVLQAQSEAVQAFLLQTSGLSRLTASLCDAVTERSDSEELLLALERANLFLEPLDASGQWYRYHALFAEAMQHEARLRFGPKETQACLIRASTWYEQRGYLHEAVETALLAEDYARVARQLNQEHENLYRLMLTEFYTLRRWLEQLPLPIFQQYPALCLFYALIIFFEMDGRVVRDPERYKLSNELLLMAELRWQVENDTAHSGQIDAFRSLMSIWQSEYHQANMFARRALACLADDDVAWRGVSLSIVATWERLFGSLSEAHCLMREALRLSQVAGNAYGMRPILLELCEVYMLQGSLNLASKGYYQVLGEAGIDFHDRGLALFGLACLSYERNQLDDALNQAQEALDIGQKLGDDELRLRSLFVLARIYFALNNISQARQLLYGTTGNVHILATPLLARETFFWRAWLAFMVGEYSEVEQWMQSRSIEDESLPCPLRLREDLLATRLLIERGDEGAVKLLEYCQEQAQRHEYTAASREIQVLCSLAYFKQNDLAMAGQMLQTVVAQAQPESYRRLFLDQGKLMADCIRAVLPGGDMGNNERYVRELLAVFEGGRVSQPSSSLSYPSEALSVQEQRVLRLFVAGLSKPEIANELIISVNTVKTHLSRIYRKLNVTSRAEAREAVRRLRLV